jgi:hypothetical protein
MPQIDFFLNPNQSNQDYNIGLFERIKKELNRFAEYLLENDWKVRKGIAFGCIFDPLWLEFTQDSFDNRNKVFRIYFSFKTYHYVIASENWVNPMPPAERECIGDAIQFIENDFC